MIINFQMQADAHCPAEHGVVLGEPGCVIAGNGLKNAVAPELHACITDMKDMRGTGFYHHCAECADVALFVVAVGMSFSIEPAIEGGEHTVSGSFDLPGFRRAEVVAEKSLHADFGCFFACFSSRNAVRDDKGNSLGSLQVWGRKAESQYIFIDRFGPGAGGLTIANDESVRGLHVPEVKQARGSAQSRRLEVRERAHATSISSTCPSGMTSAMWPCGSRSMNEAANAAAEEPATTKKKVEASTKE